MMQHGPSGTAPLGPSGTGSSDYREPKRLPNYGKTSAIFALNYPNKESFGFLLTESRLWTDGAAPPRRPAETGLSDGPQLTHLTLVWRKGEREDWLKFGKPVAEKIIDQLEGPFDPGEFNDRYEDALRKLIAEKEAHHGVVSKVEEPKEAEVIDLMEALRRSLGEGVAPRRRAQARSGKAPAARKTPARKRAS